VVGGNLFNFEWLLNENLLQYIFLASDAFKYKS